MDEKPELIAFGQYSLGGVLSFYENLLSGDTGKVFDKKIILLHPEGLNYPDPTFHFPDASWEAFNFSYNEKPFVNAQQLEKKISNTPGVVLSSFSSELAALHLHRKTKKTIFYLCHDDTYYDLAAKYSFLIDAYIAHNPAMCEGLKKILPKRNDDIYYIPYGVMGSTVAHQKNTERPLNLVFLARHVISKGIFDLPKISHALIEKNIPFTWTIFGDGEDTQPFREVMKPFENTQFIRYQHRAELFDILKTKDILVHPSSLDGLPVAMLEAMSAGLVPVVYEFNSGIKKVLDNESGIVANVGEYEVLANAIAMFHKDRGLLNRYSDAAIAKIKEQYDLEKQSNKYYNLFGKYNTLKKPVRRKLINYYNGWLEHPRVPAPVRKSLRFALKLVKG